MAPLAARGVGLVVAAPVVVWQATHDFPLPTVARGISSADGAETRLLFAPLRLVHLSPVPVPVWVTGFRVLWRDARFRAVAVAYPVLCVLAVALGGKPYHALVPLVAAGAEPAWRWAWRHRVSASAGAVAGAAMSVIVSLPVWPELRRYYS